jgi:hypothetical protein
MVFISPDAIVSTGGRGFTARAGELVHKPTPSRDIVRMWLHPVENLRKLFRRTKRPSLLLRLPATPAVVLACENCGFDYSITQIETEGGEKAIIWTCSCGSRFIPPGGVPTSQLVRP